MIRKVPFVNGHYYHIYNRGVEKRIVFQGSKDYERFLKSAGGFNNKESVFNFGRMIDVGFQSKQRLVEIMAYTLLPNHFHFLLRQKVDNGISLFMKKLLGGYTRYFNIKNDRVGHLFQGPFQAKHIKDDGQFLVTANYIHFNILDIMDSNWKEKGIKDIVKAKKFMRDYPWSSYPYYIGAKNNELIYKNDPITQQIDKKDYEDYLWQRIVDFED